MSNNFSNIAAERNLLATLSKNPNLIFDIDGVLLEASDFSKLITKSIYIVIKDIAQKNSNEIGAIDISVLEPKILEVAPQLEQHIKEVRTVLSAMEECPSLNNISLKETVSMIFTASIRRQLDKKLEQIKNTSNDYPDADAIIQYFEQEAFDFSNKLVKCNDIDNLCDGISDWVVDLVTKAKSGKSEIGIATGFPLYDYAIGGGLQRGSVNVIAGRSKLGKSFLGLTLAKNIARNNIPVLYLDTELDKDRQRRRLLASLAEVPLSIVRSGEFYKDKNMSNRIKQSLLIIDPERAKKIFKISSEDVKNVWPLDYVVVKGSTIQEQISLIRRWMAKRVGKNEEGKYNPSVIILDYLKLMRHDDKGYGTKEFEELGYRMTILHDLISQYETSMIMFVQQNRDGMEREDESTISGSDRIVWLCDSLSILCKKPQYELDALYALQNEQEEAGQISDAEIPNLKLIVTNTRDGAGHIGNEYIGLYCDMKDPKYRELACGIIKEIRLEQPHKEDDNKKNK